MKKLLTLVIILIIGTVCFDGFGQDAKTQKQSKKGGFAVGGYDNSRQAEKPPVTKRSVVIPEEAEPDQKSAEEAVTPAPAEVPVTPEAAPVPSAQPPKESQGNAYGKDKNDLEGKEFGQTRSQEAKEKQKAKKNSKSKSKRK